MKRTTGTNQKIEFEIKQKITCYFKYKLVPSYVLSTKGKVFNVITKREIKQTTNNGIIGYWIEKDFVKLEDFTKNLEQI